MASAENLSDLLNPRSPGRKATPNYLQIVPRIEIARNEPIFATRDEIEAAINNDPLLNSEHKGNSRYVGLSQYKILEGQELDLIQRLEVDTFENLRRMGFVLFDPASQMFFLMVGFGEQPIRDLIALIENEANTINLGINRAASQNGLVNGVLDGDIRNITGYLRAHHYIQKDSILNRALNEIYRLNLELALNMVPEVAKAPVVEVKVYSPEELENAVSRILESERPLEPLIAMISGTYPNEADREAFITELIPRVGARERSRLLAYLELTEQFKWSKHSINTLDKIGALIPMDSDQIFTLNILRRELVEPISTFFTRNPIWLNCWKEVINYVINRIKRTSERLGNEISREDADKIRNYLLTQIRKEFKLQIKPTAELLEP